MVRDLFVLRGRYARTRLVPDRPDVLDVPLRALLACVALSWMLNAGLSYAFDGDTSGKASTFIGALFSVGLLTVVFHPTARLFRGVGTWRQSAASSCVLVLAYFGLGTLVTPAVEWSFDIDATNRADIARHLGNDDLGKIEMVRKRCHRTYHRTYTPQDRQVMSFCGHIPAAAPIEHASEHARCNTEAIEACSALETFRARECKRAFDGQRQPSLFDRWLARMGVNTDAHDTILFIAINTRLLLFFLYMWLAVRLFGGIHGFSIARSVALFGLVSMLLLVLIVGLLFSGMLDTFEPILEFLDAIS